MDSNFSLRRGGNRARRGITQIEVVALAGALLLTSQLLLPAVTKAREAARSAKCKANLKNIGVGLFKFSMREPGGKFSSGTANLVYDGRLGWVSDLVDAGDANMHESRCPSNPLQASIAINQLLSADTLKYVEQADGPEKFGSKIGLLKSANQKKRTQLVTEMIAQGYNTNYCASFILDMTEPRVTRRDDRFGPLLDPGGRVNLRDPRFNRGPLERSPLDKSWMPSSKIPFLSDSAAGDIDEAILSDDVGEGLARGSLLAEIASDGPAVFVMQAQAVRLVTKSFDAVAVAEQSFTGKLSGLSQLYLQDTRNWFAVHGASVNTLMADGSVQEFVDLNNDGFLNPGFPQEKEFGYTSDVVELGREKVFSGVFLTRSTAFKGSFEGSFLDEEYSVSISASGGDDAIVTYASLYDAKRNDFRTAGKTTLKSVPLSQGSYIFRAYRNDRQTSDDSFNQFTIGPSNTAISIIEKKKQE